MKEQGRSLKKKQDEADALFVMIMIFMGAMLLYWIGSEL